MFFQLYKESKLYARVCYHLNMNTETGIIMSRSSRDTSDGVHFDDWVKCTEKALHISVLNQEGVFFVEHSAKIPNGPYRREALKLKTLGHLVVDGLYFRSQLALRDFAQQLQHSGVLTFESDVKPEGRYLMERFIFSTACIKGEMLCKGGIWQVVNPKMTAGELVLKLSLVSIDIKTNGQSGDLYSIAAYAPGGEVVFMVGEEEDSGHIRFVSDETQLLHDFIDWIIVTNPDVLIGWNVVDFDLAFLVKRAKELHVPFKLGRGGALCDMILPNGLRQTHTPRLPGRVILDGIPLMLMGAWALKSYSLENVAQHLLGTGN
mgnify:CR=1 FL=1